MSDVVQIYFTTTPPAVTVFSEVDAAARVEPKMALHWEAPVVTADHVADDLLYDLQEVKNDCLTNAALDCRAEESVDGTQFTFDDLELGETYTYHIETTVSVSSCKSEQASYEIGVYIVHPHRPADIKNVHIKDTQTNKIEWNQPENIGGDEEDNIFYEIHRKESTNDEDLWITLVESQSETEYTLGSITDFEEETGHKYDYRIYTHNS